MNTRSTLVRRAGAAAWKTITITSRVVANLLFLSLVVLLLVLVLGPGGPDVEDKTALVLAPKGTIVEQRSAESLQSMFEELEGSAEPETLLKDLLDAVETATNDTRVEVLVLQLDDLTGAGFTKLQNIKLAIERFRARGKKVIALSDYYGNASYYLAAQADEIYLHHMGIALPEGLARLRTYYKEGLDRLEVDVNVFRVGTYKSAVEPFLRENMSEEAKRANLDWLDDIWQSYLNDVAAARQISKESITDYLANLNSYLTAADGSAAEAALNAGLIDFVATRDEMRQRLIDLVGEDEDTHSFVQIDFEDYLAETADRRDNDKGATIGVVLACGTILDGTQPPGRIGGDSTAALIRQARNDEDVSAVVLRVDSGGGSAFASEVIRRELELTRLAGKPVVASMGSVAASGGYWITMASDEVWANPNTITGSIGIFGIFPTFQKPMAKYLGMRVDGVATTPIAGWNRVDRALNPAMATAIQTVINHGYQDFITKVAAARNMSLEEVDGIAQGRVWSGADAHNLGLVDHLGDLDAAVAAAAQRAGLADDYHFRYVEKQLSLRDKIIRKLLSATAACLSAETGSSTHLPPIARVGRLLQDKVSTLAELNDPHGLYAYCMEVAQ